MSTQTQTTYPTARRVLAAPINGRKRRLVLGAIAAFQDEGAQPSLREVATRAKIAHWKTVIALLNRCEADGLVRIEWAQRTPVGTPPGAQPRNRYELLV